MFSLTETGVWVPLVLLRLSSPDARLVSRAAIGGPSACGILRAMHYDDLGLADLKLDQKNPRHAPVAGQRETINALIDEEGSKLVKLAEDIVAHGLSPIDTFLVLKDKNAITYTVVEGNR